ncbi:uncharacterized protein LOC116844625 [Odontomachus brunneus]|uniref:uncharacterized protein LOC116844625 n=1 Tax=Odontomachus brunneus TaxID=486640 RepID=UPI0013F20F43|nr:uncharacterized protein LOC116844625 [Odontomachus brunneus]
MSNKINPGSPLANVVSEIEERRCDLIDRHGQLRDKIATMERSIPALMTCNMWRIAIDGPDCRDGTMRQIMNKFLPQPDLVAQLLVELKGNVNDLRLETVKLHDKIIDTDVKLEETTMELESVELANKEMEEKLIGLRNQAEKYNTPSLHSIHSEDLICLKKIRQFAEEELDLKSCIKELEDKEDTYRRQMKKFLPCEKFQGNDEKVMGCVQDSMGNDRKVSERNVDAIKEIYTCKDVGQKARCTCPTKSFQTYRLLNLYKNFCPPLSRYIPLDNCAPCSTTKCKPRDNRASCQPVVSATSKAGPFYTIDTYRESDIISKTDVLRSLKNSIHFPVLCEHDKIDNACEICAPCEQIDSYN